MENVTANPLNLIMIMALMGLLPFMVTLMTSYIKIIVVTLLIRNALGVQQVPPSMVLSGLALILSIFVMAPVAMQTYNLLEKEQIDTASITPAQIIENNLNTGVNKANLKLVKMIMMGFFAGMFIAIGAEGSNLFVYRHAIASTPIPHVAAC